MKLATGWQHIYKSSLEPKQNWEEIFEKNKDKNIFDSKISQINIILSPTEKQDVMQSKKERRLLMNTPPSTIGYNKNECLISKK